MQTRDLEGYGRNPPHPKWPGNARIALNFVFNVEEGSEQSVGDGDAMHEVHLTEVTASPVRQGQRDRGAESMFEYGSRVGYWRLFRMFTDRALPVTIFGCAVALERNPQIAESIRDAKWDVCAHGYRWTEHHQLDEAEERQQIAKAVESIERTTGTRPTGWYCRYAPSDHTRRLLVEEGGFAYDSDAYNDELPYWVAQSGRQHLVVPYTLTNNDVKFGRGTVGSGDQFYNLLSDAFDVLYEEGDVAPKMMTVGLHPRVIGHPARAKSLARFLDYVTGHDRVWIARRLDIANHWITHFPAGDIT
ncbi:MAG: polysaccharide deacetylase family protein [Chromatiales bacterium]|jgi:allantoinase|nr:polysaccharide deacetylase family protein [Chromatiales bacterium]